MTALKLKLRVLGGTQAMLLRSAAGHEQVQAGASTILTQPPFLWDAFEKWHAQLSRLEVVDTYTVYAF